jgi:hypothetical protein
VRKRQQVKRWRRNSRSFSICTFGMAWRSRSIVASRHTMSICSGIMQVRYPNLQLLSRSSLHTKVLTYAMLCLYRHAFSRPRQTPKLLRYRPTKKRMARAGLEPAVSRIKREPWVGRLHCGIRPDSQSAPQDFPCVLPTRPPHPLLTLGP